MPLSRRLERAPRGTHKIPQHRNVGAVGADSPRIDGETEALGKFQIHARIIKLRKTEALRGQHPIQACRIHGPRRTMCSPGTASHLVELLPIAFVPSRHSISQLRLTQAIGCGVPPEGSPEASLAPDCIAAPTVNQNYSYTWSDSRAKHFPGLLYRTRYGHISFVRDRPEVSRT